ncbi:MAG: GDP-mannose 4,6-dehydratase [Actinobacteria bacterium]|nr:GDP-mannose 4,6-dehydratase [Actinomycetota bacterium]MBV8958454.1 GDP-mannose 4,6-dehydratase [Actinomycetota bacterium]MBV9255295.1 GDP-mannose 4,6-dehydratase [Actinomycetota bacterium]MBV9663271.1 GDP-mannose 4,6-dehydratase [Actinomycetota bacterium]
MRVFVTGGHGFVGPYLRAHLEAAGDDVVAPPDGWEITDPAQVNAALQEAAPEAIYHLAAISNVVQSWQEPALTFEVNALGTLHLLEAARALETPPRVLLIGSAEVYGKVRPDEVPITENTPLRPVTPYAASKVAAEYLGMQAFLAYGLPVLSVRAFNHIGPTQSGGFVVADLARRIVEARRDGIKTLPVGNLSPRRDFTDVRDVVRAYRLLVEHGAAGEAYNVCSGRDVAVDELAHRLLELSGADLTLETDPALVRPVDLPVLKGDPAKIEQATGWKPEIPLDQTLTEVLEHAGT